MRNSLRRVRFIENENPDRNSSGGVMSYIINLTRYFTYNNVSVSLIGCGNSVLNDSKSFSFKSISSKNNISNSLFFIKLFLTKTINEIEKDEILHVQRPEMVIPLKLRTKNKIVCTLHGGQDIAVYQKKNFIFGLFYTILLFFGFYLADHLVAVDRRNYNRYIKKYPWIENKISLIPIGVNTDLFKPLDKLKIRNKYNFALNEKIMLFVGRLELEKNVDFIIKSFKYISSKNDCSLVIVGDGTLKNELQALSQGEPQIHFFGEMPNEKVCEFLNFADVLILPSKYEGSPTIVKEALACNLPVIATDVGDVKEVLELTSGGEIIELTAESFLNALDKVFSTNYSSSYKIFDYKMMSQKTFEVYLRIK